MAQSSSLRGGRTRHHPGHPDLGGDLRLGVSPAAVVASHRVRRLGHRRTLAAPAHREDP